MSGWVVLPLFVTLGDVLQMKPGQRATFESFGDYDTSHQPLPKGGTCLVHYVHGKGLEGKVIQMGRFRDFEFSLCIGDVWYGMFNGKLQGLGNKPWQDYEKAGLINASTTLVGWGNGPLKKV